jgi:nitrogenase molybdenum-iron protein alpha/beta subunit
VKQLLLVVCVLVCAGCASTDALDELKKLRADMTEKIKESDEKLRKEYKTDLAQAQQSLQSGFNAKLTDINKELDQQKEVHQKDNKEVNVTLIDVQKDVFANRRITEDTARRVYIMETLYASRAPVVEERAEGEIVHMKDADVTTSLGSRHGIKAGDLLGVYRGNSSKEKLATVRIMVAETGQSNGQIVEKSTDVLRGDVVRPIK